MHPLIEAFLYVGWAVVVILTPWIVYIHRDRRARQKKVARAADLESALKRPELEEPELRPTITVGLSADDTERQEPVMANDPDVGTDDILERYAAASHDVEILTMVLQQIISDKQGMGNLTMQQTLTRSIARAEQEAALLRSEYESH